MVAPNARSARTAAASESGIAVSVIAVARTLRQEQQHDDDDQQAAVAQRRDDVVDGDLDEVGLAEDAPVDRHARRQLLLELVELAVEPPRQLERVGARLLLDAEDDRGLPVARTLAALERARLRARRPRPGRAPGDRRAGRPRSRRCPPACATRPIACDHVFLRPFDVDTRPRCSGSRRARASSTWSSDDAVGAELVRDAATTWYCFSAAADRRHLRDAGDGQQAPPDHRVGHGAQRPADRACPTRARRTGSRP